MRKGSADVQSRPGVMRAGAVLLTMILGACTSLSPVKTPANYIESTQPKVVRITRTDGSKFLMVGAHLSGDTVMGFVQRPTCAIGEFQEFPLGDVKQVEGEQYAPGKTVLAILGGVGAWAALTAVVISRVEHVSQ